jgi:hypothetical protein
MDKLSMIHNMNTLKSHINDNSECISLRDRQCRVSVYFMKKVNVF